MFYAYGVSTQGADHIRNGVVCQDSHKIVKRGDNMLVAAVADGLGSEKYSDIASKIAADTASSYCAENIKVDDSEESVLDTIQASFNISQRMIEKKAMDSGHEVDQYDTTLSLAVLINDTLYYGHSGDSGIIAQGTDGAFYKVTEQQRDDMGRVFPLAFEDHWEFKKYDRPVGSVLLATDGMFEIFFPIYIRKEKVNIHVPLAGFFMDREKLRFDTDGEESVGERMNDFIAQIDPIQVSDDKTIVCAVNGNIEMGRQPDEYYLEPDWDMLKKKFNEEWRKAAYPDLYMKPEETVEVKDHDDESAAVEHKLNEPGKLEEDGKRECGLFEKRNTGKIKIYGGRPYTEEQVKRLRARLGGGDLQNYPTWLRELLEENTGAEGIKPDTDDKNNRKSLGGSGFVLYKKL